MRCLVAGAGGFIGGHLVRALVEDRHDVSGVDIKPSSDWEQRPPGCQALGSCDLRLSWAPEIRFRGIHWDRVYNLAADMGGIGYIERYRSHCTESVLINANLLRMSEAMGTPGGGRYFYASSACVYHARRQGDPYAAALKEEDAMVDGGYAPEPGYGEEKLYSERMCQYFREDRGLNTRVARFHNIYGPKGTWRGGREKAPAAICRKVIEAKHTGAREIEIWGDGEQTRSFCYVDDCVRALRELTESEVTEPVNVGSSELVTINQLVSLAEEFAGVKLLRRYDLTKPKGVRGRNSDNTRFYRLFGWEPSTPLREGLRTTYDWIEAEWLKEHENHG